MVLAVRDLRVLDARLLTTRSVSIIGSAMEAMVS